jgi:hypothetical protein
MAVRSILVSAPCPQTGSGKCLSVGAWAPRPAGLSACRNEFGRTSARPISRAALTVSIYSLASLHRRLGCSSSHSCFPRFVPANTRLELDNSGPTLCTGWLRPFIQRPLFFRQALLEQRGAQDWEPRLITASTVQMLPLTFSSAWLRARRYALGAHLLRSAWVRICCLRLQRNTMREERHA